VEIESCASGGGRADFEILRRTDRIWTSDCNDPIERQSIQRAFSIFFPPEVMGAHVGPTASHTTARTASMRLRAYTALAGHMGVEADLGAISERDAARLTEAIALYKQLRPWLHAGRTVRLDHPDPGLLATAFVGPGRALVIAAQIATPLTSVLAPLRISGLRGQGRWRIEAVAPARRTPRRTMRNTPFLAQDEPVQGAAAFLAHAGIPLPLLQAGQVSVYLLREETRVAGGG
jgi:alpha-galactosidase